MDRHSELEIHKREIEVIEDHDRVIMDVEEDWRYVEIHISCAAMQLEH
jgi:hypothetical protein